MKNLLTLSALLLTTGVSTAEPVTLEATPKRISMFKNGLAMVTATTQVPEPGAYQVPAPEARYGSLWLAWEQGVALSDIIAGPVDRSETTDALNLTDLLLANVGKAMSIKLYNEDAWLTGTLTAMPQRPPADPPTPDPRGIYTPPPTPPDLMLFQTENGTIATAPTRVERVRFESEVGTTIENFTKQTTLRFEADEAEGEGNQVAISYLAQGIAWSPSYVVEMIDEHTARIACKAVIVNDLMDLDGVDVELIAGYPNLQFAHAPTAMGPTPLNTLLASLQQSGRGSFGVASNTIVLQQRADFSSGYGGDASIATIPTQTIGEGAEDLYFYQVPDVTLAKGERGYFPLILAEVPACHVYTWDIGDFIDRNDRYQSQPEEAEQIVWHSLEMTNTTDQPWTTAPGMTVQGGRTLGQDTLHFTPPQGTGQLRITQAVSIDAQHNEVEIERVRNAEQFHGSTYDKVTIEGTLKITNYKNEPVKLKITKLVSGEVESADGQPEIVKVASGLQRVNPRSRLTWETDIEPGKDNAATIVYRYSFYTR